MRASDDEWPFEFGFILGSCYVQVYTRANSTCVHNCKLFFCMKKSLLLHYKVKFGGNILINKANTNEYAKISSSSR